MTLFAATGEDGGFHPPSIAEFFPSAIFFEGTAFEFNRIMLVRVVAAAVLIALFVLAARKAKLVPGRGQNIAEMGLDFVRVSIAEEILGHNARRYVPLLTTLFFAILAFNITGIIPFLNIAGTSLIGLPILMALWVYVVYLASGIQKFGLFGYLKTNLFPPGVPWFLYVLITPIEILQVFVFRPVTLALRLTANMIAGHLLLVLCFGATHFFFFEATGALKAMGVVSLAAGFGFTLFEILVAVLQAYVFTLLAAVYISMAVEEEH
ncbi:F0F1 ATP synthase subunit A [Sanguibacter suaedae]|jgi:F-type H+-transporting ATPase subunit a|uniref:ATP synthase subunit a n=1 Tax=Sanguibacter suaedae TaxID=2795737 RepID=A0A934ICH4_9MICO|nr:F0F1 ATP synthase subunit A [Sanguibacter suaedae]MBI9116135.1 F0F1 ATP synthase subunit A [Sanguibacter suaedae]